MFSIYSVVRPVAYDHALGVLTNSMWSTMMITGVFFVSFLLIFLSFKVFYSIGTASSEKGHVDIAFLFSFSGIRYINNHVRHHLFETPLLSRRRFSSLSVSWFPNFFKRSPLSFRDRDIFATFPAEELCAPVEKIRKNNSSSETNNARRYSTSSRLKTQNNENRHLKIPQSQIPAVETKNNPSKILRRNTMPNIIMNTVPIQKNELILIKSELEAQPSTQKNTDFYVDHSRNILNSVKKECSFQIEETGISKSKIEKENILKTIIEEKVGEIEECSSNFDGIISENNSSDEDNMLGTVNNNSSELSSIQPAQFNMKSGEDSSAKQASFRSAYFNYLPESIFGYSTGISKGINISSPSPSPISPPTENLSVPPGFSKRSTSLDYTNSTINNSSNELTDMFSNHQPLYARRRNENFRASSHSTFTPFIISEQNSNSDYQSLTSRAVNDLNPNSRNSSSPCLKDLQNTDDLFAPINWNFTDSKQTEVLRRSWDSLEEEEINNNQKSNLNNEAENFEPRSISTTFSSLFAKY